MKVGVLTFHNTNNYGASLQAFALCFALRSLGADVEVINYQNEKMLNDKHRVNCHGFPDTVRVALIRALFQGDLKKRKLRFDAFKNSLPLSGPEVSTAEELEALSHKYDKIICGSDQVWNYLITGDDFNYYLNFCNQNEKKVSYAASFGLRSIEDGKSDIVGRLLSGFSSLSVREKTGVDIVNTLSGKQAREVLDPTLLLNVEQWRSVVNNIPCSEEYILVYSFGSETLTQFAVRLAEKTGLPIRYIDGSFKKKWNQECKSIVGLGPIEWVEWFLGARYIVTNSFHGTVFSINFGKDFYLERLYKNPQVNSRLIDIIDKFKLSNQWIDGDSDTFCVKPINYEDVSKRLTVEREQSYSFLKNAICC